MSKSRDIADSAATINYIDGLTSDAQSQINTVQSEIDTFDPFPSQTGNAGKFLSTDGAVTSWGEVAASPSVYATASGAISNGDLVAINPDGTVSSVAELSASLAASGVINSEYCQNQEFAYDPVNNKILAIINDTDPEIAVVGTISGDSITWGTPVTFTQDLTTGCEITYDTSRGQFIFLYADGANANYLTAKTGTISGTTITFGTPVVVDSAFSDPTMKASIVYDPSTDRVAAIFGNNTSGYSKVASISGTSLSFGSRYTFFPYYCIHCKAVYVPATESIAAVFVDNNYRTTWGFNAVIDSSNNVWYPDKQELLIEGSNPIVPNIQSGQYPNSSYRPSIAAHPTEPHIFWGWYGTYFTQYYLYSFSVSKYNAIENRNYFAFGYQQDFSGANWNTFVYDENSERLILTRLGTSTLIQEFVEDADFGFKLVNSTAITDAQSGRLVSTCVYIPTEKKTVVGYAQSTTNYPVGAVYTSGISSANKYIGISDADYADGATAKIQLVGSVDDAQSGLTAGKTHYVQRNGTLSTAPDNPKVVAGTAMSATSIIVKG